MWFRMFGAAGLLVAGCAAFWWANNTWAQPPEEGDRPRAEARRPDRPPRPREDGREDDDRDGGERGERGDRPREPGDRPPPPRDGGPRDRGPREGGPGYGGPRDGGPGRGGPEGDRRPPHPPLPNKLVRALDSDRDGVISASELKDAVAALQKLDENGDGELTADEFELPPPPPPRDGDFRRGRRGDGPPPPPPRRPRGDRE